MKGRVGKLIVTYSVNGEDKGSMEFDDYNIKYISDYKPEPGDEIRIKAVNPKNKSFTVEAFTRLPAKSDFEILDIEKMYMAKEGMNWDREMADTVVKITLRLHDPAGEKNYYRLKLRSMIVELTGSNMTDVFWSDDPLFYDENLWRATGTWKLGTTPLFDDSSFDGQERVFTVYYRPIKRTQYIQWDPYVCYVDVQCITEDVYLHQKALMNYIQLGVSTYGEPVLLHSNTSTGFGIVGGITSNPKYIDISVEENKWGDK